MRNLVNAIYANCRLKTVRKFVSGREILIYSWKMSHIVVVFFRVFGPFLCNNLVAEGS